MLSQNGQSMKGYLFFNMSKSKKIISFICLIVFISINFSNFNVAVNADAPLPYLDIKEKVKSDVAVLIDGKTGQVLFEKNMNEKMYPASITKIMTALLALENGKLKDKLTMSYDAVYSVGRDTSHVALDENEVLTLEQALYALAISSANDAANGIAEHIGGTMADFAEKMTARAKELGALKTNFVNAHGLNDANHYTTAYDMARIMAKAVTYPDFLKIFSAESYDMPPTNRQEEARQFNRRNSLLNGEYAYEGVIAEKTGWTPDSGFTFVAAAERVGRTLIAVVMKSPDEIIRWEDTTALFDYGFNEFTPMSFKTEDFINKDYVIDGTIHAVLTPVSDFNCFILKEYVKKDIEIKYVLSTDSADGEAVDNTNGKLHGKAVFTLASEVATADNAMFTELGEVDLQVNLISGETDGSIILPMGYVQDSGSQKNKGSVISTIFEIIGVIVVVILFLFVVLCIRKNIIVRMRRKRRFSGYPYRNRNYM